MLLVVLVITKVPVPFLVEVHVTHVVALNDADLLTTLEDFTIDEILFLHSIRAELEPAVNIVRLIIVVLLTGGLPPDRAD